MICRADAPQGTAWTYREEYDPTALRNTSSPGHSLPSPWERCRAVRTVHKVSNETVLLARILPVVLFVLFGWSKLTDFSGTVGYMASLGLPMPTPAAAVVALMEFSVGLAIALGSARDRSPCCWPCTRWARR